MGFWNGAVTGYHDGTFSPILGALIYGVVAAILSGVAALMATLVVVIHPVAFAIGAIIGVNFASHGLGIASDDLLSLGVWGFLSGTAGSFIATGMDQNSS